MLDIKQWVQSTGMKVAENCFLKPPAFPYIIFLEDVKVNGADNKNCLAGRDITIELYSDRINREAEKNIIDLLDEKGIDYTKNRTWVDSEKFFQTVYDFNLKEKI